MTADTAAPTWMTPHEQELARDGAARAKLITGLTAAACFAAVHDTAPVPATGVFTIRVEEDRAEDGIAAVKDIAAAWNVPVSHLNGVYIAVREFGPVRFEAVYVPAAAGTWDQTDALITELRATAAARKREVAA